VFWRVANKRILELEVKRQGEINSNNETTILP
jgi:hypothetical protein